MPARDDDRRGGRYNDRDDRRSDYRRRSRSRTPPPSRDRRSDRTYRERDDRREAGRYDDRRGGRSGDYDRRRRDDDRDVIDNRPPRSDRRGDDSYRGDNRRPYGGRDERDRRRSRSRSRRSPSVDKEAEKQRKRQEALAKWKAEKLAKEKAAAEVAAKENPVTAIFKKMDEAQASTTASPAPHSPEAAAESTVEIANAPKTKFDPKRIAKKAKNLIPGAKAALGQDIAIPVAAQKSASIATSTTGLTANKSNPTSSGTAPISRLQAASKVGGFGLNTSGQVSTDAPSKKALDFDDDQDDTRTLEKLPTLAETNYEDAALANTPGEDSDTYDMGEGEDGNEEELAALAARRLAAENENDDTAMDDIQPEDSSMADAPEIHDEAMEEDVDPLDAFMSNLETTIPESNFMSMAKRPQAIYGEDVLGEETKIVEEDDLLAIAKRKKKKDLKPVNHGNIIYEDFKKRFYIEPEELKDMDELELINLRFELDGIQVRGKDVPKPLLSWPQMGLSVAALEVIRALKYEKPTPIQSQAIPTIMSGRDVIAVAKTGSGKTMGFLLPMFRHIKDQRPLKKADGPIAIIMAPTRELANQIFGECKPFLKALNLRAAVCYGQASLKDNIDKIKLGVEIVVATPGRLIDLATVNQGNLLSFKRVTYLVLDEADRLWDMGFAPQVEAIVHQIRPDRQFVMFSATFPPSMENLARKVLRKPVEIIVGGRASVAPEIEQIVEVREQSSKFNRLLAILGDIYWREDENKDEDVRTLIFVERQEACDELFTALLKRGYPTGTIHGGRDQGDRSSTINDFKSGAVPICIATSVAARGLDVKQLKFVINYDVPNHLEDYVHRAGRTGRAGQTGTCYTFITEEQGRFAPDLVKALKQSKKEVPEALQKLSDEYFETVKSGKAKAASRGFGGHGIEKLDAAHSAQRDAMRAQFGGEGGEKAVDSKEIKKEEEPEIVIHSATEALKADKEDLLDMSNIKIIKREKPAPGEKSSDPLAAAKLAAAKLGSRLTRPNALRQGQSVDNRGPDAGDYHATLEINEQPQKARWAVTNRTNVAKILEQTGVSITVKGIYYAPGKEPGPGELPKLYLLVEGDTEASVMEAMRELYRYLREGAVHAAEQEARAPRGQGRYNMNTLI